MRLETKSQQIAFIQALSLARMKSAGASLPAGVRSQVEKIFKTDFAGVRVRISPLPWALGAEAFATRNELYFAPGYYDCSTEKGLRLIGHELAHIAQQREGRACCHNDEVNLLRDDALEQEANWMGNSVSRLVRPAIDFAHVQMSPFACEVSTPVPTRKDSFSINLRILGRTAGGITIHLRNRSTVELANLSVEPTLRRRGLGRLLIEAALQFGARSRKSAMVLTSQDRGDGRLTRWYKAIGLTHIGYDRHYPQLEARIESILTRLAADRCANSPWSFSALGFNLLGSQMPAVFQCMDDDELRRRRLERFKPQLEAMATEEAAKQVNINHLKQLVALLRGSICDEGSIVVQESGGRVRSHSYRDPADTFARALRDAPWSAIEGTLKGEGNNVELIVTVRLGHGHTVTASYRRYSGICYVFHCGEVQGGVGYGTLLG